MTSLAGRQRWKRRAAASVLLIISVLVAAVTTALWRRSVLHERRAEAQKMVALGKMAMEDYPTSALAHATRSLELADSDEARHLAMEALWEGPTAFIANDEPTLRPKFSPGGDWIVRSLTEEKNTLALLSRSGEHHLLAPYNATSETRTNATFGGADGLFLSKTNETFDLWSTSERRVLASAKPFETIDGLPWLGTAIVGDPEKPRAVLALREGNRVTVDILRPDGVHEHMGTFDLRSPEGGAAGLCVPRETGEWVGVVDGHDVSMVPVGHDGLSDRQLLGRHEGTLFSWCVSDPVGRFLLTLTRSGQVKLWDVSGDRAPATTDDISRFFSVNISRDGAYFLAMDNTRPEEKTGDVLIWSVDDFEFRLRRRIGRVSQKATPAIDPVGLKLAMAGPMPAFRLWSLAAPADAEPILLRRGPAVSPARPEFSPDGQWVATGDSNGLTLWPLAHSDPAVLRPDINVWIAGLKFSPDGRSLLIAADKTVSLIPLDPPIPAETRTVFEIDSVGFLMDLDISPDGELFAVCGNDDSVWIGRDDGSEPLRLPGAEGSFVRFSPDGRHVAVSPFIGSQIVIWDVATAEEVAVLSLPDTRFGGIHSSLGYAADGRLLTATSRGLLAWDTATGDHEVVVEGDVFGFMASPDARRVAFARVGEGLFHDPAGCPEFIDMDTGLISSLNAHGLQVSAGALDRRGEMIVTGNRTGVVQLGPVGEEPHLLLGHAGEISFIEIDPLGRWIASTSQDNTVRLWSMPDLTKPPLHTLPRAELIAKLETLTNVRLVRDPESSTGWKLTHEPFQGWETVPTW